MSIQAIDWVLECSASAGSDRNVMISIANHCNREGAEGWPALPTIAFEARCSIATVKRSLARLRRRGEVDWVQGAGHEGARRKSNSYWMPAMRRSLGLHERPKLSTETTAQSELLSKKRSTRAHPKRQGLKSVTTTAQNGRDNSSPVSYEPKATDPDPSFRTGEPRSNDEPLTDEQKLALLHAEREQREQVRRERDEASA